MTFPLISLSPFENFRVRNIPNGPKPLKIIFFLTKILLKISILFSTKSNPKKRLLLYKIKPKSYLNKYIKIYFQQTKNQSKCYSVSHFSLYLSLSHGPLPPNLTITNNFVHGKSSHLVSHTLALMLFLALVKIKSLLWFSFPLIFPVKIRFSRCLLQAAELCIEMMEKVKENLI